MEVYNTDDAKFPRPVFELASMPNEWLRAIREWGAKEKRIEAIYLFGSRARGYYGANADVDLALLWDPNGEPEKPLWRHHKERIEGELKSLLPVPIDPHILDYVRGEDPIPDVFRHGIRIYFKHPA